MKYYLNTKLNFGKFENKIIEDVLETYKGLNYIIWCKNNVKWFESTEELDEKIKERKKQRKQNRQRHKKEMKEYYRENPKELEGANAPSPAWAFDESEEHGMSQINPLDGGLIGGR